MNAILDQVPSGQPTLHGSPNACGSVPAAAPRALTPDAPGDAEASPMRSLTVDSVPVQPVEGVNGPAAFCDVLAIPTIAPDWERAAWGMFDDPGPGAGADDPAGRSRPPNVALS